MAHRWVILLACVAVIISIVPLFKFVGKNFVPVDDQSQFEVTVRGPEGSTLAATSALVERIAFVLRGRNEYLLLCRYDRGGDTGACDRLLATFKLD